jgi:hypothetical protein
MDNPIVFAALVTGLLGLLGGLGKFLVGMILDAYKAQAAATVGAKDSEIRMLERMLATEREEKIRCQNLLRSLGGPDHDG